VPAPTLQQLSPVTATYPTGSFTGSGFGDVTAAVRPIDVNLAPPRATTSGCDGQFTEAAVGAPIVPDPGGPDDFVNAGLQAGEIALIQRGGCSFALKATNAQAAGAGAVIIFNQGNTPDREPLIVGTLAPFVANIPVIGASFADGVALAAPGSTAHIHLDAPQNITLRNVLAESTSGDPNNVVMAGAHLDSVQAGPGINDNGSGSATLIETAEEIAKLKRKPRNRLRFAWWGAEEAGLIGSTAYVADQIESGEIDDIYANLNFDMLASPNFVRFVYDGSDEAAPGGSAQIEDIFLDYFESQGLETTPTPFDGRSDYGPFIAPEAFVPAGGLFSGAEGVKTEEQAATYGGAAGSWYDPCYHQPCDTFNTVVNQPPVDAPGLEEGSEAADAALMAGNGRRGLGQLADGAAHATWTLGRTRSGLLDEAEARRARTAKVRRKTRVAARRAAAQLEWKGGVLIR
jgi:hypothetical protein